MPVTLAVILIFVVFGLGIYKVVGIELDKQMAEVNKLDKLNDTLKKRVSKLEERLQENLLTENEWYSHFKSIFNVVDEIKGKICNTTS